MEPKRGRRPAGTISSWLTKLNLTERVRAAIDSEQLERLKVMPVHVGKLGRAAGIAYRRGLMELHEELLRPGRDADLESTFAHELGHLIDFQERGTSDHGPRWKAIMVRLGRQGQARCHDYVYLRGPGAARPTTRLQHRVPMRCDWDHNHVEHTRDPRNQAGRRCRERGCPGHMRLTRPTH